MAAACVIAESHKKSIADVISELACRALNKPVGASQRNGVPLLAAQNRGKLIPLDLVNALRDEQS